MAVEIPVVVDINAAFKEAAAQVPSAIRPLQQSIDKYTADLMSWTEKMRNAKIDSPEFIKAAKNIQAISQALEVAEDRLLKFSSNPGSIRRMSGELAALERRWQEMGSKQKFDASGNLSADAQKLYESYKKMAAAIAESGKSLSQMYSEEQKIAEEQRKAAAAAQAHQRALNTIGNSLNSMTTAAAAWRKELNSADLFRDPQRLAVVAQNAEYLSRRITEIGIQLKILGSYSGSIDQLNLRLQEITTKYNSVSARERTGATGRALLDDYKKISKELQSQGKTIEQIIQEEKRLDALKKQSLQTRRQENAILRMTGDSMRILQAQEAILSQRLSKAKFGSAEFEQLQTRLDGVRKKLQEVQGGVDKVSVSMQKQSGILRSLTSMASMYVSVFGALRFAKQIRDVTGELEFQRIALGRLIQDVDYGNKLFDRIKAAAVESPFRIGDLVTYTKQLAAYRIEQENLFDTTRRLADISAGLGVDMNRLILAYGQVRAASVLRGQELRQFTEAGIPLVELLAEKFSELRDESVSTADVFKLISERAVPFSMIADIFEDLTDKGGMFYEMQKKQAETLKGRWEKLKDTFDIALQSIGETKTFERYNNIVLDSLTFLSKHLTVIPKLIEGASAAWLIYYAATTKSRIATKRAAMAEIAEATAKEAQSIANIKGIKNVNAYTAAMIRHRVAVNGLERGFWKLWAAIVANPLGAALAAIGAITTALVFWNKRNKEVEQSGVDLNNTIEKLAESTKDYQKVEKLAKRYETLANKTDRSAKENLKLSQTIDALNEKFPDLTLKMDDDTDAIKNNTKAISDNNKQRREEARLDAERDLKLAEQTLEQQDKQRDALRKSYEEARDRAASAENLSGTKWQVTYDRYVKEANEAKALWEKAVEAYNVTLNQVTRLREMLEPTETTSKAWKEQLRDMQLAKNGAQLFSNEAIDGWSRLYDASNDLEKEWKRLKEELDGMRESASKVKPEFMSEWTKDVESLESKLEGLELIRLFFGFAWGKQSTSRGSDNRLSNLKKDISEITNAYKKFLDLRKYMSENQALSQIGVLFPQLGGWKPTFDSTIARLQEMRDDVAKKLARSPKDKTLLEMQRTLDTEISNLKFDDLKKKIDDELKRISADIKRSETARNFYNDILGLTGDNELAASLTMSVYGTEGEEFADRIKKQLADSLNSVDANTFAGLNEAIIKAFDEGDYKYLMEHLEEVPEKLRDTVKQVASDSEKYNADLIKSFSNLVSKYGDTAQKIATIKAKAEVEINNVKKALDLSLKDSKLTPEEKQALRDRAAEVIKALEGQRDLDMYKLSDNYVKFFSEISVLTAEQAAGVREELRAAYLKAFNDGAIEADKLRRELRAIDEQFRKLSESSSLLGSYLSGGFEGATKKLQEYADTVSVLAKKMESGKELDKTEQNYVNRMLGMFSGQDTKNAKNYSELISAFSKSGGIKEAGKALGSMGKGMSAMAAEVIGALAIVDAIFQAVNSTITSIQQMIDELNRMRSEDKKVGGWFKYVSDFNKYTYSGWEKLKSGDIIGATADAVSSWISIFNNIQEDKVEKINDDIKGQSAIIEDLEYQYGRLEKSIAKSFGSDYIANYNKQLDVLAAKQAAYLEQARLERNKGKSADEDVAKGYEKSARDVADQIADMQGQLAEFFSGTDLTSAAKDFASAWIEAYKEFGSTTDAMREKFQDMLQSMVENSLAARIMQELLDPLFTQIDKMAEDGELSGAEIAQIASSAPEYIDKINAAMSSLMAGLTAAGYNIRQQPGQFTGIKRNIANATEESINGLTQATNVSNFYMAGIYNNVASILAVMTGGTTEQPNAGTQALFNNELALQYMSALPSIDQNMAELLRAVKSVISDKNSSTNLNVIAVRA